MGRDGSGLADGLPLKRKSLQDLADEGLRQCNPASSCTSPASWMHEEDLGCSRKAARAHTDTADATAGGLAGTAGPLGMAVDVPAPPGQRVALGQPLGSLLPVLRSSATCSVSVFCSSSFGAMEEGECGQESESPSSCGRGSQAGALAPGCSCGGGTPAGACPCQDVWLPGPQWPELPDDILRKVLDKLPPSYLRVIRLVCRQWEGAAGRLLRHLRPEALAGVGLAGRFRHLHSLDLSQCMASVEFVAPKRLRLQSRLTDDLLAELAGLSKLRELSLRNCNGIDGTGLLHLRGLPQLRVLNLSNCSRLSDEGLACAAQLPHVETINLQGCSSITDVGLMRLWGMVRLRHVICHNGISDVGLRILTGVTGLERLALRDCRAVGTQGVMALLQMPTLKRVVISKCPQVTMESLCGVSNLRVVNDISGLAAAAAAAAAAAGAAAPVLVHPVAVAAPGVAGQQPPLQEPPQQRWHHAHPAIMPDLHLLLADLN